MLKSDFEMKELGPGRRILGMKINRDWKNKLLFSSQKSYIFKMLARFGMDQVKVSGTPFLNTLNFL